MSNKSIFSGIDWAFTDYARTELQYLMDKGMQYDLAVAILEKKIEAGLLSEAEVYQLPPDVGATD